MHASSLADGKCPVADGVPNKVYKLANVRLNSLLSMFYSSIRCYALIPNLMSDSMITHQQMDHLYGALVDSVNLASNNLVKSFQH